MKTERISLICDSFINCFGECHGNPCLLGTSVPIPHFSAELLDHLCIESLSFGKSVSSMLNVPNNVIVVGDLHGNIFNLFKIFTQNGYPPGTSYLFLGNYIDFGEFSLELATFLLSLMICYPYNVFLLRGINESFNLDVYCGFNSDIQNSYPNTHLIDSFRRAFSYLPSSALISGKVFCCQPPLLKKISTLREAALEERPIPIPSSEDGYNLYLEQTKQMTDDSVEKFVRSAHVDCVICGDVDGDMYAASYGNGLGACISASDGIDVGCVILVTVGTDLGVKAFDTVSSIPRKNAVFINIREQIKRTGSIKESSSRKKLIVPKTGSHESIKLYSTNSCSSSIAPKKINNYGSEAKIKMEKNATINSVYNTIYNTMKI